MAKQAQAKKVVKKPVTAAKPGFLEKHAMKIAIAIGIVACIIRMYRLGFLSLWVDEYMHAMAAIKGLWKHGENNGILLTWLDTTCGYILGHNEFAMRFPVALLGAALVPATYVLARDISNYKVGLMAAVFVTLSVYLIFWSRVDRPYGMVATFYVPLLLSFWLMLERKPAKDSFLGRIGINPKYLWLVILALVLSMLSQLICFLFIFTAGFYGTFVAIDNWITRKSTPFRLDGYNILFYLNVVAVVLMLTSVGNQIMRPIIEVFLPGNIATLILPNLKKAVEMMGTDKFTDSFNTYMKVLSADYKVLPILGYCGFFLAFFRSRKLAYFLISAFIVPLLLMSFIFREPSHAKYLSYIYPVFLVSAAYSLYFIAFGLFKYISKSFTETNKSYLLTCTFGFLLLCMGFTRRPEISKMLTTEDHGNIVSKDLAEIHFVNWKQPCLFVKENMKPKDIIMATVQMAPKFYLEMDSVVWFRQTHFDATQKKYVLNQPDGRKISAYTYEQLVKTYNENPRGWLLADYYFDNALTDPKAREFVEQNFTYHFEASNDGSVKVFSWDKAKPKNYAGVFVIELGKNENQLGSQEYTISINRATLPPKLSMMFLTQGIDSDNEAYVIINGDKTVAIPTNGKPDKIAENVASVDASYFKDGDNKIQFIYNSEEGNGDMMKGYVVYNFDLR